MSVTYLIKILLAMVVIVVFSQNTAQAGHKKLRFSGNGLVFMAQPGKKYAKSFRQKGPRIRLVQSSGRRISPSAALRAAKRVAPGSQGLGVRYLPARRGYIVTLKTRGRIRRVFVDARTGRVGR